MFETRQSRCWEEAFAVLSSAGKLSGLHWQSCSDTAATAPCLPQAVGLRSPVGQGRVLGADLILTAKEQSCKAFKGTDERLGVELRGKPGNRELRATLSVFGMLWRMPCTQVLPESALPGRTHEECQGATGVLFKTFEFKNGCLLYRLYENAADVGADAWSTPTATVVELNQDAGCFDVPTLASMWA